MQPDQARVAEVRAWFQRAASDLRAAELGLMAEPQILDDVVFHCQQAVEKALKGFPTWHDQPFRKTHSIEEIGEQCIQLDSTLKLLIDQAAPLTEYAWRFRYPGDPDQPEESEARSALAVAREARATLLKRLPVEIRP